VCHFFHNDFPRCRIFDRHLGELSKVKKHLPTKFVKMDADKAKFFTAKLNIKVMPTLCMFKDGVCIDRILGFEELGSW
jgi:thioredoxin-like negative regulator of GroEL